MPPEEDAYLNAYTSIVQTQPSRSHAAGRTFFRILFSAARTQDSPYSLYAESDQMRCLRGGGHMMNTSGCRSAVLPSLKKAQSLGYDDVLWIAGDSQLLEQTCQANVFVAVDHRIITPPAPLGGAVRSDFMRDCVLDLLKQEGNHVEERVILGQDLMEAVRGGRPLELFLAGTECGIRLVTSLCYQGSWYQIPVPSKSLACQLQQTIRGIQQDRLPDPFRWLTYVDKH